MVNVSVRPRLWTPSSANETVCDPDRNAVVRMSAVLIRAQAPPAPRPGGAVAASGRRSGSVSQKSALAVTARDVAGGRAPFFRRKVRERLNDDRLAPYQSRKPRPGCGVRDLTDSRSALIIKSRGTASRAQHEFIAIRRTV